MNYDKQPINIDEQLALLQNRGLMIGDIVTAKLQLRNISYFRIASYLRYMEEDQLHHLYKLDVCLHNIDNNMKTSGLLLVSVFCNIQRTPQFEGKDTTIF